MISVKDHQILIEILRNYLNFENKIFKDDQIIQDLITKLAEKKEDWAMKTKSDLANELGITRKTLMMRINCDAELIEALKNAGWRLKQRLFYPKEVEIIKKHLF